MPLEIRTCRAASIVNTETITVARALRESGLPDLEARVLLGYLLNAAPAWLIAHDRDPMDTRQVSAYAELCLRRKRGEPVAYLVGSREFYGLDIKVSPAVLIPRPETELLVELGLQHARPAGVSAGGFEILDLGTGSGCIALAIAKSAPGAQVTAADNSPAALALARENARALAVAVTWVESDWYTALAGRRFDLIVSNPPYIAPSDAHLAEGDLRFEPPAALSPPGDGLAAIRTIVGGAPAHLRAGGWLLFEHGYNQAGESRALLTADGFVEVQTWRDLAGIERVSGGQLGNKVDASG